mgnify:CR=1 FL=1
MSDDESILWKKLENSRQVPLEPLWLENVYSPNLTFDLRKALSEKMGLLADRGWPVIQCLLQRYGDLPDLVVAAGLCHQIEAREWLLELLTRSDDDENIQLLTVQSLSCWGAEVPAAIITKCLHHPSQAQRLAGLELIKFRSHLLTDEQLLDYCNEALNDFRDSVVIAAIRIIQRRDSKSISKKLYELPRGFRLSRGCFVTCFELYSYCRQQILFEITLSISHTRFKARASPSKT